MRETRRRTELTAPTAAAFLMLWLGLCGAGEARAQWTTSGTNTTTTHNVGVGTTETPAARLDVRGGAAVVDAGQYLGFRRTDNNDIRRLIGTVANGAGQHFIDIGAPTGYITGIRFWPRDNIPFPDVVMNHSGNMGVGTANPASRLHVYEPMGNGVSARLTIQDADGAAGFNLSAYDRSWSVTADNSPDGFSITSAGGANFFIRNDGKVGIGKMDPGEALDVVGNIKATRFCLGSVCKSDWSEVGGGGGTSQWSGGAGGSGPISYSGGYVGVGAPAPVARLHVGGQPDNLFAVVSTGSGAGDTVAYFGNSVGPNGTNIMHIRANGHVGIGTANPSEKLEVANGNLKVGGTITGDNIVAKYQDVAEWVPSVQKLSAGTVVVLDAGRTNHVLASSSAYDTKVAGVVSAQPGVILGVGGEGKVMVATTGRVKVKVDATRGAIRVGDLLVTSGAEGVAMKSTPVDLGGTQFHRPGTIIGKALEPLEQGVGEVLVLLSLQ